MSASILRLSPPLSSTLFRSCETTKTTLSHRNMITSASAIQKLLTDGSKIIGVGRNYAAHAKELGNDVPKEPVLFLKPYLGNGWKIEVPEPLVALDHEVELAVVIGHVPEATAMDYVGCYALALDMTAREI
ncbi:Acylpyruvase fahd1, mitochondrial [Salvia divinorum]|uniref:Acylpyruvase fahd1, mitochondrial n=1 Tax=Salvia divinorum TaxID=28513 RepID=A0ABD1FZY3_SALDI